MIIMLDKESEAWNTFIRDNNIMIFHTPLWKIFMERTFPSVKMEYWASVKGGKIETIFPFTVIRHTLGNKVISCGFIEYGGPAGSVDDAGKIISAVVKEHSNFKYLEIRDGINKFPETKGMIKTVQYKRFLTTLENKKTLWDSIKKHKRKAVRKAEKSGITTRELSYDDVNAIYNLYSRNMKQFGSPPLSKSFFLNFFSILERNNYAKAFGSFYRKRLVSVLMGYAVKKRIHIVINVSDREYQEFRPNDAVHWKFMEWGCDNGYKIFDWGRVREKSGQFRFKKQWASSMEDLEHHYVLLKSKGIPYIDPTNPRYRFFIRIWKIMPLFLSKRIGHWFRTGIGI